MRIMGGEGRYGWGVALEAREPGGGLQFHANASLAHSETGHPPSTSPPTGCGNLWHRVVDKTTPVIELLKDQKASAAITA